MVTDVVADVTSGMETERYSVSSTLGGVAPWSEGGMKQLDRKVARGRDGDGCLGRRE